jgi:hypothetical protein
MLSDDLKRRVLTASTSVLVRKKITEAVFDLVGNPVITPYDYWEYIQEENDEDYPEEVRLALFGKDPTDRDSIASNLNEAIELLVQNIKQIVLDSIGT